MKMEIIAHRAIISSKENTVEGVKQNIQAGFSVEIDLRVKENIIYLAHDQSNSIELFEDVCKTITGSRKKIIGHIKESEVIPQILELIKKYSISNFFIFNTNNENIGKKIPFAFYANTKPMNIKENILWCDETKEQWYNKEIISKLHKENKKLYVMSIELIKKSTKNEVIQEWERLIQLEVDGICTDYPQDLWDYLNRGKN